MHLILQHSKEKKRKQQTFDRLIDRSKCWSESTARSATLLSVYFQFEVSVAQDPGTFQIESPWFASYFATLKREKEKTTNIRSNDRVSKRFQMMSVTDGPTATLVSVSQDPGLTRSAESLLKIDRYARLTTAQPLLQAGELSADQLNSADVFFNFS